MTKQQITLSEALDLVDFQLSGGEWQVKDVKGDVYGNVRGFVFGSVWCRVLGRVGRRVVETLQERLKRLIEEGLDKEELLKAYDQAMHSTTQEED